MEGLVARLGFADGCVLHPVIGFLHIARVASQATACEKGLSQGWTAPAKPTGMTLWSRHGQRPRQGSPARYCWS